MLIRCLGALQVGLYATPELLEHHGHPADLESLSKLPMIGPDRSLADLRTLAAQGFAGEGQRLQLRTDNHNAQQAALRAGVGIGVCPRQLAERWGLVRVLPRQVDFAVEVWIATHRDLRRIPRVALAFDQLASGFTTFLQS
ncbi:LysR substrate-binding domain-containing protein [Pseudomonas sp. JS3066]|uniref:LysR substrate-binding domain-containing protein n=1 Tax=Pseudomonas sp. JS3066 TaxID=3090665 RepID=UPI002E7C077A|nr:LysR substrate-binding domain-containing protein [Pseudomonas sp. JS3066]WVK91090.1 LysR substrate-binding domain-containing protein [Pseudomonas sp. JS3066]